MPQDDEIYFKAALDLGDIKPQIQDLSKYWDKHNEDIARAEKAYKDYANTTDQAYKKVNQKIKDNIKQVSDEGKAMEKLEKQFTNVAKKNKDAFDSKEVKEFQKVIKGLQGDMTSLENLNLSVDDIDKLTQKLANTKDDFEALNVIVDFFEDKMKSASVNSADSLEVLKKKIEETQKNIAFTQSYIKDLDNQIDDIGPGRVEADLISERNAAKKALLEENVALEDYKNQLKQVKSENVSLATELRRVKDEMIKLELAGKDNTQQYDELREKAEKYNDVLQRTNRELRRTSSSTESLDNLIGAVNGIVGVYSAAQGAQALFGSESEDLEKALIKLNGAIALLNGLQAVQAELAKKEAIATRVLTFLRGQYTIATNASATATSRLGAALKLSGVGLLLGGIAAAVVYWEDIAKAIGITSEKAEALNEINKTSNDLYGEQISELKLMVEQVNKRNLSLDQQEDAVKKFNETQGKTLGTVKDYKELEQKLIDQGPAYITYLENKAKAEAAYQIAVEKTKQALEKRNSLEETPEDYLTSFFTSAVNKFRSNEGNVTIEEAARRRNKQAADDLDAEAKAAFATFEKFRNEAEEDYKQLGITIDDTNKKVSDGYKKLSGLFEDLVKTQRNIKTSLIENNRDREKQILKDELEDQRKAKAAEIEALEVSQDKKLAIIREFNKIYNEENGLAYEQLRKNLQEIDNKYNSELEKVKLNALNAIDEVLLGDEERQRKAIKDRWDSIREEIFKQIDQTNDEIEKERLASIAFTTYDVEQKETDDFNLNTGIDRVEREKKTAETILKISQANNNAIIENEKIKQLQLLSLEEQYLLKSLDVYRDSLKNYEDKSLFQELINTLATATDPAVLEDVADQLKKTFGEEIAQQILETVSAIKEVRSEINLFSKDSGLTKVTKEIDEWISSLESFSRKLAEVLIEKFPNIVEESGVTAESFANSIALAIDSTFNSIKSIFDGEINGYREKLSVIEEAIDGVENQLDRERRLYEEGYANNYDARQRDLEALKAQKKQEEEELKKAQKRKAALQKTEFLLDTLSQLNNLVTAASNIFKWASAIPFVGVPLAIGLIATMFGAFTTAKVKAFQAIGNTPTFRKGLEKGPVKLSGPGHEEGGFGVHNSSTGEKVAEVENNESLYVLNPKQQKAYDHLLKAMISDARGEKDLGVSMRNHYKLPQTGQTTLKVVERVNNITIKSQEAKGQASKENDSILKEIRDFKESFKNEFEGYKEEREEEERSWETPEYYYVKKGKTTKKYKKK